MEVLIENAVPILGAVLLACFTAYLGYRGGLKSKRREEFNQIADLPRKQAEKVIESFTNQHINPIWLDIEELKEILNYCGFWQRFMFSRIINQYEAVLEQEIYYETGRMHVRSKKNVEKCLTKIIRQLRRK